MSGAQRRLVRSTTDRKVAGVCAGLAEYFGLDPTLVRALFAVSIIFGGAGLFAYVVLWIVVPERTYSPSALRVAQERYARGEIDAEEFHRIERDLTQGESP